ncbi:MAG: glucose-1-phosphate thymidylyltransferase [Cytophagales bacterium]|nr:MAG: glucose-1-phosphate thymidylyltransferase [Cytophagales bacterium]
MKAIIPVAGVGLKLRPHTHTQPKTLVPIAGKPILSHIVDRLLAGGIKDFIFVLGYLGDKIETYIRENYGQKINATYITQEPREGSAHAIWVTKPYIAEEKEVLIVLGDTIANANLDTFLNSKVSMVGVQKVKDPTLFGIAEINADQFAIQLVEKPKIPKSNLALVGIYKICNVNRFLDAIQYLIDNNIRQNNEFYLTDALMRLIEQGEPIKTTRVDNWFDCGKKETILEANAILLNNAFHKKKKYQFPKTIIIEPVSIGENCTISHAIIGPNVAIGENTIIKGSIISNSIIGSFSELEDVVLKNSVIGNDSSLKGLVQSLNIGDSTEINFNK